MQILIANSLATIALPPTKAEQAKDALHNLSGEAKRYYQRAVRIVSRELAFPWQGDARPSV